MLNIFIGLIFIFFKTNFSFWDIGTIYYVTNIIGYISILYGINDLGRKNLSILKVKPYVIIMIAHSIIVFLLNITGNSPLTMGMSTMYETIIILTGVVFVVTGMFMVFIVIFQLMDSLPGKMYKKVLYNLVSIMMFLFILAGISAIFDIVPAIAPTAMGALLLLEVLFLISYYFIFLTKNKNIA